MNVLEIRGRAKEAGRFLMSLSSEHRQLEMRQPHLSQHLTRLRESGMVMNRRASRTVYYRLGSERAERMIGLLYELFCRDGAPTPATDSTPPADNVPPST